MRFKNFERKLERESLKRTIFASCRFESLQMVSKRNTGWCASEEAEPQREWTQGSVPSRTLGPEGEWIGGSHIDWRRERVPVRTLSPEGG